MKIAAEKAKKRSPLKNALLIGAGTAAGTGAAMLAEKHLLPHLVKGVTKLPTPVRAALLAGGAGLAGLGTQYVLHEMEKERKK